MRIKRYTEFISEEIFNMSSWPSLFDNEKNGYVLPMLLWSVDIFEESFKEGEYETPVNSSSVVKLVKSWNLENNLVGSYFEFICIVKENTEVFSFCDEFEIILVNIVKKFKKYKKRL